MAWHAFCAFAWPVLEEYLFLLALKSVVGCRIQLRGQSTVMLVFLSR